MRSRARAQAALRLRSRQLSSRLTASRSQWMLFSTVLYGPVSTDDPAHLARGGLAGGDAADVKADAFGYFPGFFVGDGALGAHGLQGVGEVAAFGFQRADGGAPLDQLAVTALGRTPKRGRPVS